MQRNIFCPSPTKEDLEPLLKLPQATLLKQINEIIFLKGYQYIIKKGDKSTKKYPEFILSCDHHGDKTTTKNGYFKTNCQHKIIFKPKDFNQKVGIGPWKIDWLNSGGFEEERSVWNLDEREYDNFRNEEENKVDKSVRENHSPTKVSANSSPSTDELAMKCPLTATTSKTAPDIPISIDPKTDKFLEESPDVESDDEFDPSVQSFVLSFDNIIDTAKQTEKKPGLGNSGRKNTTKETDQAVHVVTENNTHSRPCNDILSDQEDTLSIHDNISIGSTRINSKTGKINEEPDLINTMEEITGQQNVRSLAGETLKTHEEEMKTLRKTIQRANLQRTANEQEITMLEAMNIKLTEQLTNVRSEHDAIYRNLKNENEELKVELMTPLMKGQDDEKPPREEKRKFEVDIRNEVDCKIAKKMRYHEPFRQIWDLCQIQ
ncbi:uncharacterized protein I206_105582 [Kwoniella pini CBS 10737]|uniref:Uncharacterized protein n=1 Tax=Kwoniella pini CBS 10737 TaxID=1296096 RepID=A0AAJ8L7I5_9TREE